MSTFSAQLYVSSPYKISAYNLGPHGVSTTIDGLTLIFPSDKEFDQFILNLGAMYMKVKPRDE